MIDPGIIAKFEDHFFSKSKGAYTFEPLIGLFESNEKHLEKIAEIKEAHRHWPDYITGLKWFAIRQAEIDGLKWQYTQLKSEFTGEVAEQLKKHPTAMSYCLSLRNEIEWLKENNVVLIEFLQDIFLHGTRHSINPAGEFLDCGCFNSFKGDHWQSYIRSMDQSVRDRAKDVIQALTTMSDMSNGVLDNE